MKTTLQRRWRDSKKYPLQAAILCGRTVEEVQRLPIAEQADSIYQLLGRITDALADQGYSPAMIAQAVYDLGHELIKRDGTPIEVVRT